MSVITDDQLRALIRASVARHLATPAGGPSPPMPAAPRPPVLASHTGEIPGHVSHYQYLALINVGEACVIEPSVACNHCGYCRSHGH